MAMKNRNVRDFYQQFFSVPPGNILGMYLNIGHDASFRCLSVSQTSFLLLTAQNLCI